VINIRKPDDKVSDKVVDLGVIPNMPSAMAFSLASSNSTVTGKCFYVPFWMVPQSTQEVANMVMAKEVVKIEYGAEKRQVVIPYMKNKVPIKAGDLLSTYKDISNVCDEKRPLEAAFAAGSQSGKKPRKSIE